MIDQQTLLRLFSYDQVTGHFTRILTTCSRARAGTRAGFRTHGYRRISINGEQHYEHRLAWIYIYGTAPDELIDHADGDGENNSLANLRLATKAQNMANSGLYARNTSGAKGVVWHKKARKWMAQIQVDGKHHYLGLFEDIADASRAYQAMATGANGSFVRKPV